MSSHDCIKRYTLVKIRS